MFSNFGKLDINSLESWVQIFPQTSISSNNSEKYTKSCLDFRNDTWLRYSNSTILMSLESGYTEWVKDGVIQDSQDIASNP